MPIGITSTLAASAVATAPESSAADPPPQPPRMAATSTPASEDACFFSLPRPLAISLPRFQRTTPVAPAHPPAAASHGQEEQQQQREQEHQQPAACGHGLRARHSSLTAPHLDPIGLIRRHSARAANGSSIHKNNSGRGVEDTIFGQDDGLTSRSSTAAAAAAAGATTTAMNGLVVADDNRGPNNGSIGFGGMDVRTMLTRRTRGVSASAAASASASSFRRVASDTGHRNELLSSGSVLSMGCEEELLVLVHGLKGAIEDFTFFREQLLKAAPTRQHKVLVHATDVNTDKTHDGIVAGGTRIAEDVRKVVAANPSLRKISFAGFSLGGIYVRYAIGLLFNKEDGTVAGLEPHHLVTIASPNLGVRAFGVFRFIPQPMMGATKFLFGPTGEELVLMDDPKQPLLLHLTTDDNPYHAPFMSALRAFTHRTMYGNIRQDFMVNFGTSVIDASVQGISGNDLFEAIDERAKQARSTQIDKECDEKGCKVAFTYSYPLPPAKGDPVKEDPLSSNPGYLPAPSAEDSEQEPNKLSVEAIMAKRLQALDWTVVAIDFPISLPIAHNRIMAMSRNPIHTWINCAGRRAVLHLVDTLLDHYDSHNSVFQPMNSLENTSSPSVLPSFLPSSR